MENSEAASELFALFPGLKRVARILFPVIAASALMALFTGMLDAFTYDRHGIFFLMPLLFGVIPASIYISFRLWTGPGNLATGFTAASTIATGILFGRYSDYRQNLVLRAAGVHTTGIVTRSFLHNNSPRMYYEFNAGGERIESLNLSNPQEYATGDTIRIVYSAKHPGMNMSERELQTQD